MEYEDKLVDFIDGELPEEEERELFSMISMDDSLRSDYKSLLSITNNIKASAGIYTPTTALKESVYHDLNITLPIAKHTPAFAKFVQGNKWHLLSGGIGALLATSAFMVATNFFSGGNKVDSVKEIINPVPVKHIESEYKTPIRNYDNIIIKKKNIGKIISAEESEPYNNLEPISESKLLDESQINYDENLSANKINTSDILFPNNKSESIQADKYINNKDYKISFEGRYSTDWNFRKETIQPSKMSQFNNLGLEIFFSFLENFDFGININQETFFVKYDETVRENIIYNIEQNPNLTSFGISLRNKFFANNFIQTYGKFSLSVNNFGIILRPSVGISLNLYDNISLVEYLEYSNMLFTHKQNWFSASKIGLNFGMNYKF